MIFKATEVALESVVSINPRKFSNPISDTDQLSFVPMKDVLPEGGGMHAREVKTWAEVKKGFTAFQDGDVVFAKITPCMENGKFALAEALTGGRSAGTTEFHVLRPAEELNSKYLLWFLFTPKVRRGAKESMSGAVGQQRVPTSYLAELKIPLPTMEIQEAVVSELDLQFSRLDAGIAALKRAQANLKRYRASVLKAACEGRLVPTEHELAHQRSEQSATEQSSNPAIPATRCLQNSRSKAESSCFVNSRSDGTSNCLEGSGSDANPLTQSSDPSVLQSYESGAALLARILEERRKSWTGKGKYKEPVVPDITNLPGIPEGWAWATVDQLASPQANSITDGPFGSNLKTEHYTASGPRVIRLQNIGDGFYIDAVAHISDAHFQMLQKHSVCAGDIVIAGLGESPPRSCIVPASLGPAIVKADCIRFNVSVHVLNSFLNFALNSDPTRRRMKEVVHGVGRPRLNLSEIKAIVLPCPCKAEQTRIVAEVERRLSVVDQLEAAIAANLTRATRLRQAILQRVFSPDGVAN